ncbi:MAG: NnrS family protein [Rhodocyclaceae bacterium]|nr:NnrS family protein [Rhodocyclaceae bacterium]
MSLLTIKDPMPTKPAQTFALFALGFRPFYLLAASFTAMALPVWMLVLSGVVSLPLPGIFWHAHEMIFGFAAAVIVGFLFTAGRNWTGLPTPTGGPLAALAGLWLLGRIGMAWSGGVVAALIDWAFLPAAAIALALVLIKADSRRNYFIIVLLSVLALANAAFHLARLDAITLDPLRPLWFALGLITVLETVIGGRVIPMFTASALRGVKQWQHRQFELSAIALTAIALLLWVLDLSAIGAPLAALAAVMQLIRCIGWNPWAARRSPLLWILHLAHLWIPTGLALLALVQWGVLPRSAAVHALAIGATGGLIIGMITRTALGHTGRVLVAGKIEITAYVLVQLAAVSRVLTIIAFPSLILGGTHLAATLWAIAFGLYFIRYLPWLASSRPDGRPG